MQDSRNKDSFGEWAVVHMAETMGQSARLGYDVRAGVLDYVLGQAAESVEVNTGLHGVGLVEGTKDYHSARWRMRPNPHGRAIACRETIAEIMSRLNKPAQLEVQVFPVQRITWNWDVWHEQRRRDCVAPDHETVVIVRFVAAGMGERLLVFSAE